MPRRFSALGWFWRLVASLGLMLQPTAAHAVHSVVPLRVGEATNPGPSLLLGTSNPTGLRSKEPLAIEFGPGIWHYSETQLSSVTVKSCSGSFCAALC